MRQRIRKLAKELVPPVVARLRKGRASGSGLCFTGDYPTWEAARRASHGYDSPWIADKVKDAMLKVRDGEAAYERDSVLFDKVQYAWPLLAGLLWIASRCGNRLDLVDFGGSLGSSYYQNRRFLAHLGHLRWSIIEQGRLVEYGKEHFENKHVRFYRDLDECFLEQAPEAILLSGVLQYLEDPYGLLERIDRLGFEYVIVDRTSFMEREGDKLVVQKVPPHIFDASYPCWFLDVRRFLDGMGASFDLVADFDSFERADIDGSAFKGFIFRRRS